MPFPRKTAIVFVSFIFVIMLFGLPALVAANHTIGSAKNIEKWLRDSKLYDRAVKALVEKGDKAVANDNQQGNDDPFKHPEVQAAAEQAFSPQFLQSTTENVIDGTFGWLSGKTDKPQFQIDIGSAKQKFATAINAAAKQHYASLPVCPRGQPIPADFEPFSVTCRIPGYDANAEIDRQTSQITAKDDFLGGKNIITADDIKPSGSSDQQPFYKHAAFLPLVYRLNKIGIVILALLTIGTAVGLVYLYENRGKGVRRVSIKLIFAGVMLLLAALLLNTIFNTANSKLQPTDNSAGQQLHASGLYIAKQIEEGIRNVDIGFGVAYVLIGVGGIVAAKKWLAPIKSDETADAPDKKTAKTQPSKNPAT